jgi:poly(3-hydroxybutyrate) depolymerase
MAHAALQPLRALSDATRLLYGNPFNPLSHTPLGQNLRASAEMFERVTRRYSKPSFGITTAFTRGERVSVTETIVWEKPFCRVIHFEKSGKRRYPQPRMLIVAPMSGHYATLLRGTVEAFLPTHDVFITDWADARMVPLAAGAFSLDDYIDYLIEISHALGNPDPRGPGQKLHTLGVCQPGVPLIAAIARMEAMGDPMTPASMTIMGSPIDTRRSPTLVNQVAEERGVEWFQRNCIYTVPLPYAGAGRRVYPGYLQLSGFMAMNLDRHVTAHREMYQHLVRGDGDSAEKHRDFYDEYLAVMDLTEEFYMQTIDRVFVNHLLPKGEFLHRGVPVDMLAIRRVALMTIEGEKDDISGLGQTQAAQDLCVNIPAAMKVHYMQKGVGHYGVFNGSRFRSEIAPRIADFIANVEQGAAGKAGVTKKPRLSYSPAAT